MRPLTETQKARARRHIAACRADLAAIRRRLDDRDARTVAERRRATDALGRATTKAARR